MGAIDDREMGESLKAFLPGRASNPRVRGAATHLGRSARHLRAHSDPLPRSACNRENCGKMCM
jgi:hypothetical protein